jgi:hypothetical protein
MNENALNYDGLSTGSTFKTIRYAGLAAGILDGLAAVGSSALNGVSPARLFQYIASALLGRASFESGLVSVLLALHYILRWLFPGREFIFTRAADFRF